MVTRRSYSKDFKIEAVRLLVLGEKPASQLALELVMRRNQIYKWRDQLAAKGGDRLRQASLARVWPCGSIWMRPGPRSRWLETP